MNAQAESIDGYVYFIHTIDFSHYYIGSTNNSKLRRKHHLSNLRGGRHCNERLQRAFIKHGEESLLFSVALKTKTREEAALIEQELLDFHYRKPGCMNVSSNGIMSANCPEVVLRRNATLKGITHRKSASDKALQWREKNPQLAIENDKKRTLARQNSATWKIQNSKRCKLQASSALSKEKFKQRIRVFYENGGVNAMSKPVIRISLDGSEVRYSSASEAIKNNPGLHANSVSRCRQGKGHTANGYRWRFG